MPTFVIRHSKNINAFMHVKNGAVHWVTNVRQANTYPSKYALKRHLDMLKDNCFKDVLEEFVVETI